MSIKAHLLVPHFLRGASPVPPQSPLHGGFVIGDKPSPELVEAGQLTGQMLDSLTELVARAEGRNAPSASKAGVLQHAHGRDYFRCTVLPETSELHCINVDCQRKARFLIDARDEDVKPFCAACAYVEFSMWMVGA